jgi:hypothetical protein
MRYNLDDVLRKVITYYDRKYKNAKNEFLVMIRNCYQFYEHNIKFIRN